VHHNANLLHPSTDILHQELANILNQAASVQNTGNNLVIHSVSDDDEPPIVQMVQYRYRRPAPDVDDENVNENDDEAL